MPTPKPNNPATVEMRKCNIAETQEKDFKNNNYEYIQGP